jgi:hypothetical protein
MLALQRLVGTQFLAFINSWWAGRWCPEVFHPILHRHPVIHQASLPANEILGFYELTLTIPGQHRRSAKDTIYKRFKLFKTVSLPFSFSLASAVNKNEMVGALSGLNHWFKPLFSAHTTFMCFAGNSEKGLVPRPRKRGMRSLRSAASETASKSS